MRTATLAALLAVACAHAPPPASRTPPASRAPPAALVRAEDDEARATRLLAAQTDGLRAQLASLPRDDPRRPALLDRRAGALLDLRQRHLAAAVRVDPRAAALPPARRAASTGEAEQPAAPPPLHDAAAVEALAPAAREHVRVADLAAREALETLRALVNEHPAWARRDETLFQLAFLLGELGADDHARRTWLRLIRDYPASVYVAHAYVAFGEHSFARGEMDLARQFYERATQFPEGDVTAFAYYKLAWALLNLDRAPEALVAMERAVIAAREHGNATLLRESRRDAARFLAAARRPLAPAAALAFLARLHGCDAAALEDATHRLAAHLDDEGRGPEAAALRAAPTTAPCGR